MAFLNDRLAPFHRVADPMALTLNRLANVLSDIPASLTARYYRRLLAFTFLC